MSDSQPLTIELADAAATERLGGQIAELLPVGSLVFLVGELGAGKTTLVRGLLRSMGFNGSTKSPTYTLVEPYQFDNKTVYHFDLYRLADPEELEFIGIHDYLDDANALTLIEWPEQGEGWLPDADLVIKLNYVAESREAIVSCRDAQLSEKARTILLAD
ncbi:MAG: tRNA (adenosine(37)-N6)-threonylcarbamoyltransferase complex ATPase subunit type 1 TsaE [Kangiellaceae bacterium]|jgi:tRNA threonylcarbamoyladenosine biosynthesis protein TsaE|nr:tRNA (adenosine(37)-N6)-threonylcarbamoyltransferase complex ATPase subunit type 1 TsaE [Kangiellaceae bacterium]